MREDVIYSSIKYNDFVFKKENRVPKDKDVKDIAESMKRNGWVGAPIEVSKQGDKLVIEEGQHRYLAAKMLNIPVKFMLVKPRKAYEEAERNRLVKKWMPIDYIEMYARNDVQSYKRVMNLVDEFPNFNLGIIKTACGISGGATDEIVRSGRLQFSSDRYIETRNLLADLAGIKEALKSINFVRPMYIKAFISLLKMNAIDKTRMIEKIQKYGRSVFVDVASISTAIDYIERVYNFNSKKDIVYLVDQYKKYKRGQ